MKNGDGFFSSDKEDVELKVMKSKVLDAIVRYDDSDGNMKKIFQCLFPNLFSRRYKAGTIFRRKGVLYPISSENRTGYYILAYAGESRRYHLVHLADGFTMDRCCGGKAVFIQEGSLAGVEISQSFLDDENLLFNCSPDESEVTRK